MAGETMPCGASGAPVPGTSAERSSLLGGHAPGLFGPQCPGALIPAAGRYNSSHTQFLIALSLNQPVEHLNERLCMLALRVVTTFVLMNVLNKRLCVPTLRSVAVSVAFPNAVRAERGDGPTPCDTNKCPAQGSHKRAFTAKWPG